MVKQTIQQLANDAELTADDFIITAPASGGPATKTPISEVLKLTDPVYGPYYGPYASLNDAMAGVPEGMRLNRTVKIGNFEYWWINGTALSNLLIKPQGGTNYRVAVTVATYAAAQNEAVGSQYKEIKVLVDETDNGAEGNRYLYDGVPGELELIF